MATQAQIEANRRNSKRSTGPRTEEGKGRTRFNALVHGLTAQQPLLPDECPAQCRQFLDDYVFWLNPTGFVQQSIAKQAATTAWRQQRIARFETIASLDDECLTCKGRSVIPSSSGEGTVASGDQPGSGEGTVASGDQPGSGEGTVASGEQLGSGEGTVASGEQPGCGEGSVASGEAEAGNASEPTANSSGRRTNPGTDWQESPYSLKLEMCAFLDSPRLNSIMRYETHLSRLLSNHIKTLVMLKRERTQEDDRMYKMSQAAARRSRRDRDPEEEAAEIEEEFEQALIEQHEQKQAADEAEAAAKARAAAAEHQGGEERAWHEQVRAAARKFMKEQNLENAPDKEQEAKVRKHLVDIGLFPKPPQAEAN